MAFMPIQSRPALGQVANLGAFYDSTRDSFLSASLVANPPLPHLFSLCKSESRQIQVTYNDALQDKFHALGVGNKLAASFLAGMVPVSGSGYYFKSTRPKKDVVEGAVFLEMTTDQITLNLDELEQRSNMSMDAIRYGNATHVVTGMRYGARIIVAARMTALPGASESNKQFKSKLDKLAAHLQRGCSPAVQTTQGYSYRANGKTLQHDTLDDLNLAIFSDIDMWRNLQNIGMQEVDGIIKEIPTVLPRENIIFSYDLVPINYLRFVTRLSIGCRQLSLPSGPDQVHQGVYQQFIRLFDQWRTIETNVRDYLNDTRSRAPHGTGAFNENNTKLDKHLESCLDKLQVLQKEYSETLHLTRQSLCPASELNRLLQKFYSNEASPKAVSSILNRAKKNCEFKLSITDHGGQYVDYDGAQRAISVGSNIYIMYFTEEMRKDKVSWEASREILTNLLARNPGDYIVAAAECRPRQLNFTKPRISFYQRSEEVTTDMLEQMDLADQCFAVYNTKELDSSGCHQPRDPRLVRIPCPGRSCNHNAACDWTCYRCRGPLEYYDNFIYCECGRAPAKSFSWQCNDPDHGRDFSKYPVSMLDAHVKTLHSYKEVNILLLGETGVGKSTWINAFYNYMLYRTLDDALAHEKMEYLIPSSFSMQYIDDKSPEGSFVQCDVKVGSNDSEHDGSRGDSATQKSTEYKIRFGNMFVRLIDTPGVGDVRGVQADAQNLSNILQTLNKIPKLDGIIILLKPNTSRLTLLFRFCVKELLSSLHRDAARNIVWGFTNTRQSNYMPGDAYKPLERLLQQHESLGLKLNWRTVFCFDSESFRCLAARKQLNKEMAHMEDFHRSWERSVKETKRLLEHFLNIEPHQVRSTISLNRARELISQLTQPMASIADTIQRTIALNKDKVDELSKANCKGNDLKKQLHFERIEIQVEQLDHPRTVCKHYDCVEMKTVGGTKRPIYKSICHDRCSLKGVDEDTVGHHKLMNCAAFQTRDGLGTNNCDTCKHHWQEHMHIRYSQVENVVQDVDPDIQNSINNNVSDIKLKKSMIKSLKAQIKEAEKELVEIRDAAIKFGLFLKKNSIAPYNDAMIAYLDEMIKEERQYVEHAKTSNISAEKNERRLANLEKNKQSYAERIKLLETHMNQSNDAQLLDEQGVDDLINRLCTLKQWGKNLQDLRTAVDWSQMNDFNEQQFRPRVNKLWQTLNNFVSGASRAVAAAKSGFIRPDPKTPPRVSKRSVERPQLEGDMMGVKRRKLHSGPSPSPYHSQ
ncbi:hypothetical protein F5B20DRAFT_593651 [Whalleya microplaca]|nr:hypothetical protein F5B20DRAFT_593651 [Whalleya microplaca]